MAPFAENEGEHVVYFVEKVNVALAGLLAPKVGDEGLVPA